MKINLSENIFDILSKIDLEEELDPSIDANEVLYEDNDYSKTPREADNYRTDTEDVLGFELNGNQVQYLATSWPEFYHNAHKYASMKDQILDFMKDEGLLSGEQEKAFDLSSEDDLDDIDYEEPVAADSIHPQIDGNNGGFKPLNVQSWEPNKTDDTTSMDSFDDIANEQVEDDDFDPEDEEILNNILSKKD